MTPPQIQSLRRQLGESTTEFAARFARSPRSIEDWEQGRRRPDALCLRELERIAEQLPKKSRKRSTNT